MSRFQRQEPPMVTVQKSAEVTSYPYLTTELCVSFSLVWWVLMSMIYVAADLYGWLGVIQPWLTALAVVVGFYIIALRFMRADQ